MLWFCQSVAFAISAMVAPWSRRSSFRTISFLLPARASPLAAGCFGDLAAFVALVAFVVFGLLAFGFLALRRCCRRFLSFHNRLSFSFESDDTSITQVRNEGEAKDRRKGGSYAKDLNVIAHRGSAAAGWPRKSHFEGLPVRTATESGTCIAEATLNAGRLSGPNDSTPTAVVSFSFFRKSGRQRCDAKDIAIFRCASRRRRPGQMVNCLRPGAASLKRPT